MLCVTDGSTRRYRQAAQLCSCTVCLPHRQQRLTTALGCMCKCSSGWGKETIWTQKNGAGYECGITLSQWWIRIYHQHQRLLWRSSDVHADTIATHEGALARNTDWTAELRVVNARVSAARTRRCCQHRSLTTLTKRVASLKLCSMRSYVHFDYTWMLSVLAYMPNVISSEFVIGYDDEFANNTLVTINLLGGATR